MDKIKSDLQVLGLAPSALDYLAKIDSSLSLMRSTTTFFRQKALFVLLEV
jgi:hypothetical protein